jgi:ComF family protein
MMAEYLKLFSFEKDIVLCDVPLHKHKMRVRGFNQSEILAKQIAKRKGLIFENLLNRRIDTVTQVGLTREERENNLREAFVVNNSVPKNILIIDDVFTSGSTLNQCARVLKESGAEKVYGFVFAKSRE